MYPTLRDGERVVVDTTACRKAPPAVGDVVLARHPFMRDTWMINRIVGGAAAPPLTPCRRHRCSTTRRVGAPAHGRYVLQGDNPVESSDSRSFGPVPLRNILGRAVHKVDGWPLSPAPAGRE